MTNDQLREKIEEISKTLCDPSLNALQIVKYVRENNAEISSVFHAVKMTLFNTICIDTVKNREYQFGYDTAIDDLAAEGKVVVINRNMTPYA